MSSILITREMWEEAHKLSLSMIDVVQQQENVDKRLLLLALAISYSTYAKATNMPVHSALELVMTIYKNTEIIDDDDEM